MDADTAVPALAALAQASRLTVYRRLVECAPQGAAPGELCERLAIPAATLSFHLKTLQQAGLIEVERQGRSLRYRARIDTMQTLIAFLSDRCCDGQPDRCRPAEATPPLPRKSTSR